MIELRQELLKLTRALDAEQIEYGLCGGLAVAVHGYPRATQDMDFLILPKDKERVRSLIGNLGYTVDGGDFKLREGQETEISIWRVSRAIKQDLLTLDFVLVSGWLEALWEKRIPMNLENEHLVVLNREALCKMKKASGRAQDAADIENLIRADDKS